MLHSLATALLGGGGDGHALEPLFGWDPLWISGVIFVLTYGIIMTEKYNRAVVALLGAGAMILFGVYPNQEAAIHGIDWNTIGLLTGMMVIVAVTQRTGVFQYLAIWSAKKVNARPWGILVMLSIVTAVLSALLDNVTTVLLIAPVGDDAAAARLRAAPPHLLVEGRAADAPLFGPRLVTRGASDRYLWPFTRRAF